MTDLTAIPHSAVWAALDTIAERNGLTPSALALRAGLDAGSFNASRRVSKYGKPHYPHMRTVGKALAVTQTSFSEFATLVESVAVSEVARAAE